MKTSGVSAACTFTSPLPESSTDASWVRAVSDHAVPAVETSADLTARGCQPGCRSSSSAAAPATCGAAMLVPSNTANGPPKAGIVDERIAPPGAPRSGLRTCPKAVGPPEEKLVTTPPRPWSCWSGARPSRAAPRPLVGPSSARICAPSASAIIAVGIGSGIGIGLASLARLSTSTIPTAPAAAARSALVTIAQCPRETSAIEPVSEPRGSVVVGALGSGPAAQSSRSTGRASVPAIVPMSTRGRSVEPQATGGSMPAAGTYWNWRPATVSAGPKRWVFESAATEIDSGATPGDPAEPNPNSSRSLPAEITGTTPAAATFATASTSASLAGSVIGPPPEKLITFIPSRTADSNAATISGVCAVRPIAVGTLKTR